MGQTNLKTTGPPVTAAATPATAAAPKPAASPGPAATRPALAAVPASRPTGVAPTPTAAPKTAPPAAPSVRKLKKGEILFNEGENSRAMYLLKSGVLRIFKKKGETSIEIGTVRSGELLGELAFLDGNPRSASGEALVDSELVEINVPAFQEVMGRMPEWLKILLKTVVGRLRGASTRIRQLESANTNGLVYDKDGAREAQYIFLSTHEALKIASGVLLVAARYGKSVGGAEIEFKSAIFYRYINQIFAVPEAKITSFCDILRQCEILKSYNEDHFIMGDMVCLEQVIQYMHEESFLEAAKRHDITPRSYEVMTLLQKYLDKFPADPQTGVATINLMVIKAEEAKLGNKEPFQTEEFQELIKMGYCTTIQAKSGTETLTTLKPKEFTHSYAMQKVVCAIHALNVQKNVAGKRAQSSK